MPRSKQRFSFLSRALKAAGGTAEAGSRLAGYKDFKDGKRSITVEQKISKAERTRYAIALLPFGINLPGSVTNEDRYRATITNYSNAARTGLGLNDSALGYTAIDAANEVNPNYYPAQLRCFIPSGETKTQPTSGVTGKKYSRTPGKSVTIPFGRGGSQAADSEQTRRLVLAGIAKGTTAGKASSVSYVPEYFAGELASIDALPTQAP